MSELPQGWAMYRVGDLVDFNPKNSCPDDTNVGFVPLQRLGVDYRSRHTFEVRQWFEVKRGYTHFTNGDVLLAKITPSFENGKAGITRDLPNGLGAGSTEYFVFRPFSSALLPEYLLAHFKTPQFLRDGEQVMSGVVGQQRVPKQFVLDSELPLPPLNEQRRIADKLDTLLARVDACRERLDRVPAILKRFRQAVLAAAVSGELTAEWRASTGDNALPWRTTAANATLPPGYRRLSKQSFKPTIIEYPSQELPDSWSVLTIGDLYDAAVLLDFADGNHGSMYPRKEEFGSEGVKFLTATQIGESWELNLSECPRLLADKAKLLVKGWAKNGDVLLTHNATVGRVGLLEGADGDVLLGTSVTFYRFNPHYILPAFARIMFSSTFFQEQLQSVMEQTTRDQVPITKQVSLNFICPPLEEQGEIVRRVEKLLGRGSRISMRHVLTQRAMNALTPSLLAKAFRGELVEQDPNDEPAAVLLERIRAGRDATGDTCKRRWGSRAAVQGDGSAG